MSFFHRAPTLKTKKTVTIKSTTKKKTPPKGSYAAKTKKKWRVAFDENQTQIDAGQKRFGTTECNDCGLLYQQVSALLYQHILFLGFRHSLMNEKKKKKHVFETNKKNYFILKLTVTPIPPPPK